MFESEAKEKDFDFSYRISSYWLIDDVVETPSYP